MLSNNLLQKASQVAFASIPFFIWEGCGNEYGIVIAVILCVISASILILWLLRKHSGTKERNNEDIIVGSIDGLLSYPYIITICTMIGLDHGADVSLGFWAALLFALGSVAAQVAKYRK